MGNIKPKEKPCKGTTAETKNFGCGDLTYHRVHGLCKKKCYPEWLMETEAGKIKMQKSIIEAKRIVKANNTKETRKAKIRLLTADKYREKYVQPKINKIARLIDYLCHCIATDNFGKMNGGHYISVGANRSTSLNLHNIHIQSFESNHFKSGDNIKYEKGIIERYGIGYLEFMKSLHQTPKLGLKVSDLELISERANRIIKELESENNTLSHQRESVQRILLRDGYNKELGIYDAKQVYFFIF